MTSISWKVRPFFFLVAHMNQDDFPFEDVEPL